MAERRELYSPSFFFFSFIFLEKERKESFMKKKFKKKITSFLCTCLCIPCIFCAVVYAKGDDPLVTLSYLTEIVLPQLKKDILADIMKSGGKETTIPEQQDLGEYTLIELEEGQTLYADSVLEFIVRPGSIIEAVSPFPSQGVADITGSAEYLNGDTIELNSYCVIPRGSDGRGIISVSEKSFVLVRGQYHVD